MVERLLSCFGPELELIAAAAALVAVVNAPSDVHGEDAAMLWLGFVERAVAIPLRLPALNAAEAKELKYLLHGDDLTKLLEGPCRPKKEMSRRWRREAIRDTSRGTPWRRTPYRVHPSATSIN